MTNQNSAAQAASQSTVLTREEAGKLYKNWVCIVGVNAGSAELCIREIESSRAGEAERPSSRGGAACGLSDARRGRLPQHAVLRCDRGAQLLRMQGRAGATILASRAPGPAQMPESPRLT